MTTSNSILTVPTLALYSLLKRNYMKYWCRDPRGTFQSQTINDVTSICKFIHINICMYIYTQRLQKHHLLILQNRHGKLMSPSLRPGLQLFLPLSLIFLQLLQTGLQLLLCAIKVLFGWLVGWFQLYFDYISK